MKVESYDHDLVQKQRHDKYMSWPFPQCSVYLLQDLPLHARVLQQRSSSIAKARRVKKAEKAAAPSAPGSLGAGNASRKFKRENKNRPTERTSKRPVPRFREILDPSRRSESFKRLPPFRIQQPLLCTMSGLQLTIRPRRRPWMSRGVTAISSKCHQDEQLDELASSSVYTVESRFQTRPLLLQHPS